VIKLATLIPKIVRFKRGLKAKLPQSGIEGQPYFTMDTSELYIGMGDGKDLKKIATQQKIITFVYKNGRDGQFGPAIKFPYGGKIISASANCTLTSTNDTAISIDKISETDYKAEQNTWNSIFSKELFIPANKKFDDGTCIINETFITVQSNDYFRLNMTQYSNIQDIVVELVIELTNI
jgi:hypothetical protein